MNATILIVDDEVLLARSYAALLQRQGYQAFAVHSAASARVQMEKKHPDLVLMDLKLPDGDGVELVGELSRDYPDTAFVMVSGYGSIRSAVEATKRGAIDYLTKPVQPDEVYLTVRKALEHRLMSEEVHRLRGACGSSNVAKSSSSDGTFTTRSEAMREVFASAKVAARQDGIVLLLGESGVGKDVLAHQIHKQSHRSNGPFFSINCAALPRELAEAELFGYEPGAFTGASGRKRGLLELAQAGTLLLDEIGELDLSLQAKLLRFLDTKKIMRIGGERLISVQARLIAATNRDLEEEVEAGRFRKDLFYRLSVFPITLPPLRERREDIELLTRRLLDQLRENLGMAKAPELSTGVLDTLERYDWPGNVRELRNVLERALMLSPDGVIRSSYLNLRGNERDWQLQVSFPDGESLHELTKRVAREVVKEALRRAGTKTEAARLLGLSRHALAHQLKALGIDD